MWQLVERMGLVRGKRLAERNGRRRDRTDERDEAKRRNNSEKGVIEQ